eukprot:TRINITY_DN713_c0_g1_i10.p2 TRINITY_DN713_c0_g1~~TRINITY_DN713_c0_g1_i10.p2  ORF type:complete len:105 (-),score=7.42 TRINITY_DN713_c0_g1_i10:80-394(-)
MCREPRGFGFVQYYDPRDAADAKYYMDRQILLGRELSVVFAEESRKRPEEMRMKQKCGRYHSPYYYRSCSRSWTRSRSRSLSRSRSCSRSPDHTYSRESRRYSR